MPSFISFSINIPYFIIINIIFNFLLIDFLIALPNKGPNYSSYLRITYIIKNFIS